MDRRDGHRQIGREVTPGVIIDSYPVVGVTRAKAGGGDKRKERTPPEMTKAKRSRPNVRRMGNGVQPTRRVIEPLRDRTHVDEELVQTDLGNPRARLPRDCLELNDQDAELLPSPRKRRPARGDVGIY